MRPVSAPEPEVTGLDRLTGPEKEALYLLAQGHTAKSIAALTGRSVGAVNERLREARRKTGVGSSRELARRLKAQESWNNDIGVAGAPSADLATDPAAAPSIVAARTGKGSIMVASFSIAALAGAAALLMQGSQGAADGTAVSAAEPRREVARLSGEADPLLGKLMGSVEEHPSRLYALLRSEARDPAWADPTDAALKAGYADLVRSGRLADLRVTCASTVCEVAGSIVSKQLVLAERTLQQLQDLAFLQRIAPSGLKSAGHAFGPGRRSEEAVFASYWLRQTL